MVCKTLVIYVAQCVVGPWLVRAAGLKKKLAHKYMSYTCVCVCLR